jgi:hypothetical protein
VFPLIFAMPWQRLILLILSKKQPLTLQVFSIIYLLLTIISVLDLSIPCSVFRYTLILRWCPISSFLWNFLLCLMLFRRVLLIFYILVIS